MILNALKKTFVTLIKVGSTVASSAGRHLLLHMYVYRISETRACFGNDTVCMKLYHILLSYVCSCKILVALLQKISVLRIASS